jgi:threonine dehydrogenase-like Zn-dependent dehydrogenase
MRALRFFEDRVMRLVDEPEPVPADDETVVEVAVASVCGSDIHGIRPGGFRTPPLIMGHEFAGTTPDGRLVAVRATLGCGACRFCDRGMEYVCTDRVIIGIDRPGGFQERVAVPDRSLVEMPAGSTALAGAIVEPLAVARHAWRRASVEPGATAAVLGSGTIGLLLMLAAADFGVEDVTVVDLDERRLELAKGLGASAVTTALEGSFDVIFDAVGAPATRERSVSCLYPGGSAVWLGCQAPDAAFDALHLVRSEKEVKASFAYSRRDFEEAAEITPTLDLDWIEVVDFSRSEDVFRDLAERPLDVTKVAFRF